MKSVQSSFDQENADMFFDLVRLSTSLSVPDPDLSKFYDNFIKMLPRYFEFEIDATGQLIIDRTRVFNMFEVNLLISIENQLSLRALELKEQSPSSLLIYSDETSDYYLSNPDAFILGFIYSILVDDEHPLKGLELVLNREVSSQFELIYMSAMTRSPIPLAVCAKN